MNGVRRTLARRALRERPLVNGGPRGGFTLWETALVLAVLAITLLLAAPAIVDFGKLRAATGSQPVLDLLRDTRREAIQTGTVATLRLDPASGRWRVDTTGVAGMAPLATGTIDLGGATTLVTDAYRLQFIFQPTGAAFADSVGVRDQGGTVMVLVDPWTGIARAEPR